MNPKWGTNKPPKRDYKRILAEFKVGWVRVSGYLGILNFILILGIWLDRNHSEYVVPAYLGALTLMLIGVWVDRRFIWPGEQGINESVSVLKITECFRSAKHIVDLEDRGVDTSPIIHDLKEAFRQTNLLPQFEEYLSKLRRR